jgi:cyclohexyl-isocyanide hydratase
MHIGMLLFPNLTQLDLTGPYEVFHRLPGAKLHMLWKRAEPVRAEGGLALLADTTLADCPALDVLFVPGGFGQVALMNDAAVLDFLREQAATAKWITSVCTGSLLLGAAGLLRGYRATTHWAFHDLLAAYGATPVEERVVVDRNRMTGGGVTSGIDFALRLAAEVGGAPLAKELQLALEYDPAPPFPGGHPRRAEPDLVARLRARWAERIAQRRTQAEGYERG